MKNLAVAFAALGVIFTLGACSAVRAPVPDPVAPGEIKSVKQRLNIAAPTADVTQLVAGNNAFAFDLYRTLGQSPGNLFFSPHSISSALAMTFAGARGATAEQMAKALHFELPGDRLHPAFNSLDQQLAQRGQGAQGKDANGFRLRNVNALWGQKGYTFLPTFLDTLAENYGAGLRTMDFTASEDARQTINNWVSDQTEGKIKDLIARGALDASTRLVLTNAIYFNAAWAMPFSPDLTRDGDFYLLDGSKSTVPMMSDTDVYRYAAGAGYQAVELPYDKRELSMIIVLPSAGQSDTFESTLDSKRVQGIVDQLASKRVAVTMPKFKVETSFLLADVLQRLGMSDAFRFGSADFSGMDGTRNLFISQVIHKAYVDVNEEGTEAAAATAVILAAGAIMQPESPIMMKIDRPFVFLIRDSATGAILFLGRVADPAR